MNPGGHRVNMDTIHINRHKSVTGVGAPNTSPYWFPDLKNHTQADHRNYMPFTVQSIVNGGVKQR